MADRRPIGTGASSPQPKILRVGVVQAGRIIEERLIRGQTRVTLGASPRNTVVVPASAFPRSITLFERKKRGAYSLRLPRGVGGRVALGDEIICLEQTDRESLPLTEASRGKVQLGETTLLFQFVTPPRLQPRPQLPPSVRGGFWANLDWTLAACLAAMIAVHGGLVAYMSGLDHDREVKVDLLPEFIPDVQQPIVLDVKGLIRKGEPPIERVENETAKTTGTDRGRTGKGRGRGTRGPRIQPCDEECLRRKVSQVGLIKLLGNRGNKGEGLAHDLIRSGDPGTEAAKAFRHLGGLEVADRKPGAGLQLKDSSGPYRPGDVDIDQLGPRGPRRVSTGEPVRERVPRIRVDRLPPRTRGCDPDKVAAIIRRGMPAVRTCYQRAIKDNPTLAGKLTMRLTINTMGRVTRIEIDDDMGAPGVASCTRRYARRWRFPPPRDGTAEVSVPLVFRASR